MIAEISLVPVGRETSLSPYVAKVLSIIQASGIRHEFHAMGTNLEGEYDEIVKLVKKCADVLFEMGANRVLIRMQMDDRRDQKATLESKKVSVKRKLNDRS